MLANLDAGNFSIDRLELAANFRRRVLLEIEHILVRRAARQKDHDNCLVRFADPGLRLGAQQLRQRQTAERERADLEKVPARNAVTKTRFITIDRQHNPSRNLPPISPDSTIGCIEENVVCGQFLSSLDQRSLKLSLSEQ